MSGEMRNSFPFSNDPAQTNFELRLPSTEELEVMSFEEMLKIFKENDRVLLGRLEAREVPYFGLHGAAKPALEYHQTLKNAGEISFDTATFHTKGVSKRILLDSLYACADVSAGFGFTGAGLRNDRNFQVSNEQLHEGGIEVVNLEREGENYAILEKQGGYRPNYPVDINSDVVTARGIIYLSPKNFDRIIKVLGNEDLGGYPEIYLQYLNAMEQEYKVNGGLTDRYKFLRGKVVYTEGLLNQKIVEESLNALKVF